MAIVRILLIAGTFLAAVLPATDTEAKEMSRAEREAIYRAQQAMEKGDHDKARAILDDFIKNHPKADHPKLFYALGNALYLGGNPASAYETFQTGLRKAPGDADLRLNLAKTAYELGKYAEAGSLFETAYEKGGRKDHGLLEHTAAAYYQADAPEKAKALLEPLLHAIKSRPDPSLLKVYVQACIDLEAWDEAETAVERLLKRTPGAVDYWELLAQIRLQRGEHKAAASALAILYSLRTPTPEELDDLADIYLYTGAPLKALRVLEQRYGENRTAEENERLARIALEAGRTDQAFRFLDEAIAAEPTAVRYFEMGRMLYERGQWRQAMESFEASVKLSPENPLAHLLIGYCAMEEENAERAEAAFRAAAVDPAYADEAGQALKLLAEKLEAYSSPE